MSTREHRTVKAVRELLPATLNPLTVPALHARRIGRALFWECPLVVMDTPGSAIHWEIMKATWEAAGRGFLATAHKTIPYWMKFIIYMVETEETYRMAASLLPEHHDPVRLAKGWVWLCIGYREDEVIEHQMKAEALDMEYDEWMSENTEATVEDKIYERVDKLWDE